MGLTREEVEHVALLSRLALSPEQIERMTAQLQDIVAYAEKIQELPLDDVEPMSHPLRVVNVMREGDEVGAMLSNEEALANAPDRADPYFRVPKVTEQG